MPLNPDPPDESELASLARFRSPSESDVVLALLQSEGIPAVYRGRYNPKAPREIFVPRGRLEEANRLVAGARESAGLLDGVPDAPAEEPRSRLTVAIWILASGALCYALFAIGRVIYQLARAFLR
ncbi:MAG: DUF2007 domain-containing protein [Acidobacteriia bacterium]|nr:DUF2007 domain-containing protein [Terriglobia bacterium]